MLWAATTVAGSRAMALPLLQPRPSARLTRSTVSPALKRVGFTTRRQQWKQERTTCNSSSGAMPADPSAVVDPQNNGGPPDSQAPVQDVQLSTYHYVTFFIVLAGGLFFVSLLLYFTGDINFQRAFTKVVKRLGRTVALPQLATIVSAMAFVKYGLEPVIKAARKWTKAQGPYEKSSEYYILREVYKPLEFLFLIAAVTTLAENFLPQVINVPKSIMQTFVRTTLSLTFVIAAARVVFNIKSRIVRENSWQMELKGDLTKQRRLEALDKLMSLATIVVASIFGVKALGMDVNSVLAIGGVGGVAVGLAGREILENLFTGLIILSSNPFEVGEEVMFRPNSGQVVEGIVVDVGWYRTTIRSFEREIFIIPNSVFSRNVVLNITRKQREWRFYEFLHLRLEDLPKSSAVVSDIRKILRQDNRIIQKLHRRVFLDKVTREDASIYVSFYVEAANRDAFMAVKQDLLLAFIDCVERNGARLARNKLQLEMLPSLPAVPVGEPFPLVDVPALPQAVDVTAGAPSSSPTPNGGTPPPPTTNGGTPAPQGSAVPPPAPAAAGASNNVAAGSPSSTTSSTSANAGAPASSTTTSTTTSTSQAPKAPATSTTSQRPSASMSPSTKPPITTASATQPTTSSSSSSSPSPTMPSPQAIASALTNSPTAADKLKDSVISPDKIVRGTQAGSIVLGSFDDRDCDMQF
jgi:mechanosensitive ion channel protein 1/2/3